MLRSGGSIIDATEFRKRWDRQAARGTRRPVQRPMTFGEELFADFHKNMRANPELRHLFADDDDGITYDYFEKADVEDEDEDEDEGGVGEAAIKAKLQRRDDLKNEIGDRLRNAKDKIGRGPLSEEQRDAWIAEHPADRRLADADVDAKIVAASRAEDAELIRELGLLEVEIAGWPEEIERMQKRADRDAYKRSPRSRAAAKVLDEDLYPKMRKFNDMGRGYVPREFHERAARIDLAKEIAVQEQIRDYPPFSNRERVA